MLHIKQEGDKTHFESFISKLLLTFQKNVKLLKGEM